MFRHGEQADQYRKEEDTMNENDLMRRAPNWNPDKIAVDPKRVFLRAVFETVPGTKAQLVSIVATNGKTVDTDAERTRYRHLMLSSPLGRAALKNKGQGTDAEREQALDKWVKDWKLTAPWCRQLALKMIDAPFDNASLPATFFLACPGWDPLRGGWPKAEEGIRQEFEHELRRHKEEMARLARERQFLTAAEQRNGAHFLWAARFQCGGEEYQVIAQTANVTRQNVGQAVRKVLARIDLTARPPASKGGRPPKIKPQS